MQIYVKTLTGKQIVLYCGDDIEIGPRREDGTFVIRTPYGQADAVEAQLMYAPQKFLKIGPLR